ncbi:MAG: hypothetical protein V7603_3079 [Micromonosporaceae bacterium]|jgi:hypothetical protein
MVRVTADDIRVLAQDNSDDPVLVATGDRVEVVPAAQAGDRQVVYTKADLIEEYGPDLTDVEAQLAAANLTATLAA